MSRKLLSMLLLAIWVALPLANRIALGEDATGKEGAGSTSEAQQKAEAKAKDKSKAKDKDQGKDQGQEKKSDPGENDQANGDAKGDPDLGMSILGNQEAPKALVIVPWKRSEIGASLGISTLLDDSRQPIDKEVFMRVLSYYEVRTTTTRQVGGAQPANAAHGRK